MGEAGRDEAGTAEVVGGGDASFTGNLKREDKQRGGGCADKEGVTLDRDLSGGEWLTVGGDGYFKDLDGSDWCRVADECRPSGRIGGESAYMVADCFGRGVPVDFAVFLEDLWRRCRLSISDELILGDGFE